MGKETNHKGESGSVDVRESPGGENGDITGQKGTAAAEKRFTMEQLLCSARFLDRRDLVGALLSPGRQYTVAEAEQEIRKYMKGKVK